MTPQDLKEKIIYDNKIKDILKALKMKHIRENSEYISCCMPDGDNQKSTIVYKDNLYITAYTRDISDSYGSTDIFSLTMYLRPDLYFTSALRWICEVCGYDYYGKADDRPNILNIFSEILNMRTGSINEDEEITSEPIDEYLLTYYDKLNSKLFYNDGISYRTQRVFDIRYDGLENRIVIPIRDEGGVLVGLKGRLNNEKVLAFESKYMYLTTCNKSSILFGLDVSYDEIKRLGIVYVAESEKSVMQAHSCGIKNVVAIGGKKLSKTQVKKLTYLGVEVCLCYDDMADVNSNGEKDDLFYNKQRNLFLKDLKVSAIIDKKKSILGKKESPFDNMDMWEELTKLKREI